MHRTPAAKAASFLSLLVQAASRWFHSPAAKRRGRRNESFRSATLLGLEGLEERAMMAVDMQYANGVLTITGDASNNTAQISMSGSKVQAKTTYQANGTTYTATKTFTGVSQIKFYGQAGDDVFTNSTSIPCILYGGAGNDNLSGGSGNDFIYGEAGNDVLSGGAGDDNLFGGDGDDFYVFAGGTLGKDVIQDGVGVDALDFRGITAGVQIDLSKTSAQTVSGNRLTLTLSSSSAIDDVYGSNYADQITGNAGANRIWGFGGDDTLSGMGGNDLIYGGDGNDTLAGGDGNDTLYGDAGVDVLLGQGGADTLYGGDGNDWLYGDCYYAVAGSQADGADVIYGGAGDDYLAGGDGDDQLYGDAGVDTFNGGAGYNHYHDDFALFNDGASITDVVQGQSGVCTILAAIGTSFDDRTWTNDVRYVSGNLYDVRLYNQNGTSYWERTSFDGSWTDDDARPGMNASGVREAWVIIVQRAALQRDGVDWTKPSATWSTGWQYLDVGMQTIQGGARSSGTIAASTSAADFAQMVATKNVTVGSKPSGTSSDVVPSHAYTVLSVYQQNGQWYVNLYNPWGVDGQYGAVSGANDGMVTLRWSAFTSNFNQFAKA